MLTPDHPNAQFIRDVYVGGAEIENDESLDADTRNRRLEEHIRATMGKLAPNFIIHTSGFRLGAKGEGLAFLQAYNKRRTALGTDSTESGNRPAEITQVIADDHFAVVCGVFESDRGGEVFRREGMGVWRFEDGVAVEHWEIGNSRQTDAFFLAGDPDWTGGTAEEFWLRDQ